MGSAETPRQTLSREICFSGVGSWGHSAQDCSSGGSEERLRKEKVLHERVCAQCASCAHSRALIVKVCFRADRTSLLSTAQQQSISEFRFLLHFSVFVFTDRHL